MLLAIFLEDEGVESWDSKQYFSPLLQPNNLRNTFAESGNDPKHKPQHQLTLKIQLSSQTIVSQASSVSSLRLPHLQVAQTGGSDNSDVTNIRNLPEMCVDRELECPKTTLPPHNNKTSLPGSIPIQAHSRVLG